MNTAAEQFFSYFTNETGFKCGNSETVVNVSSFFTKSLNIFRTRSYLLEIKGDMFSQMHGQIVFLLWKQM